MSEERIMQMELQIAELQAIVKAVREHCYYCGKLEYDCQCSRWKGSDYGAPRSFNYGTPYAKK